MKNLFQLIRNNAECKAPALRNEAVPETLWLYDVIDPYWGVSASDFNKALAGMAGQRVTLRVNSPGGDVFDGRAMASAIRQHGNVHAVIEGVAASAATYVTAACASVTIAPGSFYMIHKAWTMGYGTDEDFIQTAGLLAQVDTSIVADYVAKSGKSEAEIVAWMSAETWFTADEAVAHGFADALTEAPAAAASASAKKWDLTAYSNAPKIADQVDDTALWEQVRQRNMNRMRLHEFG